jgi:hypothetical protein
MSDFLKPNVKTLALKWMVQAVKILALYLRGSLFEYWPGYRLCWLKLYFSSFIQGIIWGEESGLLRCDVKSEMTICGRHRCENLRMSQKLWHYLTEATAASHYCVAPWLVPSALVGICSEQILRALLTQIINVVQPNHGWLLCKNYNVFGNVWLLVYKRMKFAYSVTRSFFVHSYAVYVLKQMRPSNIPIRTAHIS